jgi:hypothetical protein
MSDTWRDGATAGPGYAVLIRTANALAALRCYWSSTHHMDVIAGIWLACRRDGRGCVVAADCPAELHLQLAHQSWPWLMNSRRPRLNDRYAGCRPAVFRRVRFALGR